MKCFSAAVIRTVCLVLSLIVALSDAKSIRPAIASLSPAATEAASTTTTNTAQGTGTGVGAAAVPSSSSLPSTPAETAPSENERQSGANDPPVPAGQEHRSSTRRVPGIYYGPTTTSTTFNNISSSSRFMKYVPKYSMDHLLEHDYEHKISNDIDLDPCKTAFNPTAPHYHHRLHLSQQQQQQSCNHAQNLDHSSFSGYSKWEINDDSSQAHYPVIAMGDIALPNVNYESQWQAQRFNKSFQAELETLKKEVYNEGLQVEEEGLTDIIRKKTKQVDYTTESLAPDSHTEKVTIVDRERNNAAVLPDDSLHHQNVHNSHPHAKHNFKNIPDPPTASSSSGAGTHNEDEQTLEQSTIVATIIDNRHSSTRHSQSPPPLPVDTAPTGSSSSFIKVVQPLQTTAADPQEILVAKNASASVVRHNETDKIQSNSKDIVIEDFNRNAGGAASSSTTGNNGNTNNNSRRVGTPAPNRQRSRRQQQQQQHQRRRKAAITARQPHRQQPVVAEQDEDLGAIFRDEMIMGVGRPDFQYTHRRVTRAATAKKERIWDYGVIPYEIDANFSGAHKALFKQAMRHWENFTCIKFVERNPEEHPNYIVFTERSCGCCSYVGKRGNGPQAISIGKNCDKFGIVVHELGHVVGFWHEHTRPDRENHVVIQKSNILNGQEYNFNKLSDDDVNSLGLPYDYHSIMHYARNTFSKSTHLDTIHPVEIKGQLMPEIGQRIRLSEGDIAQTNLLYKCSKCGQTFQDNAGTFASPHYFSAGPPLEPEKCEWRITATHGERIVLNITDLDIFKSNNCRTDYLEIRDGYWHKSPIIGKFCGSGKVNELFTTNGSRMLITYMTSHRQGHHKGFTANYEAVCGGELNLEAGGRIESPNYPLDYLPNKECIWRITVPEEYQVALKFQSFEVENHDNCVYDYVEVRDGHSPDSRLIGVFCGYKIPPDMRSTGNKMYLKFVSDGSVQKAGFSATYMKEVDECETHNHGCQHECINTLGGYECSCSIGYELHSDKKMCENACGGIIDAHNGTITSPSFPEIYPLSKDCVWEIVAPPQYKIILNFTHFDLEGSNFFQAECDYDSLTVYSKTSDENMKRHGLFCGPKLPPMITSESNVLRIEFTSDSTIQKSGFAAIFLTDIDECTINNGGCQHECKNTVGSYLCSCHNGYMLHENGHDCREGGCKYEVTAPQGQIASPNYPDYYPANKDCVWHFSTTPGHRIRLQFTNFEIEPHQECVYDSIMIYDGDSTDSNTLGRFCGSKLPHIISASSNEMYMVFKSDASIQRNGFLATHATGCGGYLQATNKVKHFYSHARYGHNSYDKLANCDWTIETEVGKSIQLTFLTFDIEDEQACSFDYVEIFDGFGDSRGSSYGKFCGSNNPPDIISQNEALLVRFQSDETMVFKGFSVSYVAVVPFEEDEEMSSDSEEAATAFPGSLRSIFAEHNGGYGEEEEEEEEASAAAAVNEDDLMSANH